MDIVIDHGSPSLAAPMILGFCAVIAILLIWRTFRKPDVPTWGRRGKRK
ncbi:hypothetical protein [Longimicrobium terrae]|uniref:Uncharacterized protein n=1 Tax=Longimicrobium terrae TaxID=1639882 RepID=A0A841GXF2_9BACT|nr:hypothetical protein [Longimicrobium terrae]MBB4635810.1 hypothetical protein [Longimicrobium terrae]MBB6070206.1 hypothetical protein [Longimicrobium terrae]NNC30712.1 hypothetical protein [Longimicrobium terrae]